MKAFNRFMIVGSGGREHAIVKSLIATRKKNNNDLFIICIGTHRNPGLVTLCNQFYVVNDLVEDIPLMIGYALDNKIQVVVIGPEAPLDDEIVDSLSNVGIPCIGPYSDLATIETYKVFTRRLLEANPQLSKYNPRFHHYDPNDPNEFEPGTLSRILEPYQNGYVIKAVGLKGGKGVKVSGDHFSTFNEAYDFCQELADKDGEFLIEERLIGREFSLMSLCDGTTNMIHLPIVQDYKRAYNNDVGPNTGGMGAIMRATDTSQSYNNLPNFITKEQLQEAQMVNQLVLADLMNKSSLGHKYVGVLYGSFMITTTGELKVIEYNARFGDPEVINLLHSLQSDLSLIFTAMIKGSLRLLPPLIFSNEHVVCRYLCPISYPMTTLNINMSMFMLRDVPTHSIIYSHVIEADRMDESNPDYSNDKWMSLKMLGSRAIAVVTSDPDPQRAISTNDSIINIFVNGHFRFRSDIGQELTSCPPSPPFIATTPTPKSSVFKSLRNSFLGSHRRNSQVTTYESAGVSIDEGNRAVDLIKSSVHSTQNEYIPRDQYGAFAGLFNIGQCLNQLTSSTSGNLSNMQMVASMDGVGTKVQTVVNLLPKEEAFYLLGQDLFANNINDILCIGREVKPLFFLDYYGTNKLNADHLAKFVQGLSKSCRESHCVLLGGETAELPDFSAGWRNFKQPKSDQEVDVKPTEATSWEMVGIIVGLIQGTNRFNKALIKEGDRVLAFPSSGPHTNGYSLINRLITEGKMNPEKWIYELTCPHRNYYTEVSRIWANTQPYIEVKGLCHITGGGLIDNPPRILPNNVSIEWKTWQLPPIFEQIQRASGLSMEHMHRTFNCGLGMLMVVPDDPDMIKQLNYMFPDLMDVGIIREKK
jgi:phosphoribosylamine--glycine ligase